MVYNLMFTFSFQFISVYIDIPFFMYKYELYILYNLQILCLLTFKIIQVDGLFSGWKIKLVNLDHWRYFKKFQDKKKKIHAVARGVILNARRKMYGKSLSL